MEKIGLLGLNLLLTENCDLECAHCMRGNRSGKSMTSQMLDLLFSNIRYITDLNISGGEPFINPQLFKLLVDKIIEHDIKIGQFGIITNGTYYNEEVLKQVKRLSDYTSNDGVPFVSTEIKQDGSTITSFKFMKNKTQNQLSISADQYHDAELLRLNLMKQRNTNVKLLKQFSDENNIKFTFHNIAVKNLSNLGRAKLIREVPKYDIPSLLDYKKYLNSGNIGEIIKDQQYFLKYYFDKNFLFQFISVNPDGYVTPFGDISFNDISTFSIGNITSNTLTEIIQKKAKEEAKYVLYKININEVNDLGINTMMNLKTLSKRLRKVID